MNIFHMIHYSLEISSLVTWSLQTALPTSDCHHSAQPIPAVAASPRLLEKYGFGGEISSSSSIKLRFLDGF